MYDGLVKDTWFPRPVAAVSAVPILFWALCLFLSSRVPRSLLLTPRLGQAGHHGANGPPAHGPGRGRETEDV